MTSADPVVRRAVLATTVALAAGAAVAPAASAEVLRVTTSQDRTSTAFDAPDQVAVAAFPATADAHRIAGVPVVGLPDEITTFEAAPAGGPVAYVGDGPSRAPDPDALDEPPRRPLAGLLPVEGGAARPFTGPTGGTLGRAFGQYSAFSSDLPEPWISWAPDRGSVVLHAFATDRRTDPWLSRPVARRCDVATARCAAPATTEVVDLPGGGTVEVDAALSAPQDDYRIDDSDAEGRRTARRFQARADRRYAVTVRVAGRPGTPATFTTTGTMRRGAPAYDRSFPSAAGVLVRTSRIVVPRRSRLGTPVVGSDRGKAVIVRADSTIRSLGLFGYEVVGTLPDGRWILTGGSGERFGPGPSGEPLRTLDAEGRIAPILCGSRPVSPIWAASTAGLKDSLARSAEVRSAGIDGASGLLVLVLRLNDDDGGGNVVTVPLDGAAPPRLVRDGPGTPSDETYLVR